MPQKFETRFPSDLDRVRRILEEITRFVSSSAPKLHADERTAIKLIFSELLCNAVIHGNHFDSKKLVYLYIYVDGDVLQAQIADEGQGFDFDALITGYEGAGVLEGEHGRGIRLVRELTDSLSFRKNGREIYFHKRLVTYE